MKTLIIDRQKAEAICKAAQIIQNAAGDKIDQTAGMLAAIPGTFAVSTKADCGKEIVSIIADIAVMAEDFASRIEKKPGQ